MVLRRFRQNDGREGRQREQPPPLDRHGHVFHRKRAGGTKVVTEKEEVSTHGVHRRDLARREDRLLELEEAFGRRDQVIDADLHGAADSRTFRTENLHLRLVHTSGDDVQIDGRRSRAPGHRDDGFVRAEVAAEDRDDLSAHRAHQLRRGQRDRRTAVVHVDVLRLVAREGVQTSPGDDDDVVLPRSHRDKEAHASNRVRGHEARDRWQRHDAVVEIELGGHAPNRDGDLPNLQTKVLAGDGDVRRCVAEFLDRFVATVGVVSVGVRQVRRVRGDENRAELVEAHGVARLRPEHHGSISLAPHEIEEDAIMLPGRDDAGSQVAVVASEAGALHAVDVRSPDLLATEGGSHDLDVRRLEEVADVGSNSVLKAGDHGTGVLKGAHHDRSLRLAFETADVAPHAQRPVVNVVNHLGSVEGERLDLRAGLEVRVDPDLVREDGGDHAAGSVHGNHVPVEQNLNAHVRHLHTEVEAVDGQREPARGGLQLGVHHESHGSRVRQARPRIEVQLIRLAGHGHTPVPIGSQTGWREAVDLPVIDADAGIQHELDSRRANAHALQIPFRAEVPTKDGDGLAATGLGRHGSDDRVHHGLAIFGRRHGRQLAIYCHEPRVPEA
mmetsp:Transcript_1795/g.7833  ORF Transcript_1795/g.7833 Transcript_1795/m.7833 type:complete len:612 (+) Transcript_1795:3063-4898(+)